MFASISGLGIRFVYLAVNWLCFPVVVFLGLWAAFMFALCFGIFWMVFADELGAFPPYGWFHTYFVKGDRLVISDIAHAISGV